jgi:hypothetical protein
MRALALACALVLSLCAITDAAGTVPFKATIEGTGSLNIEGQLTSPGRR